MQIGVSLLTALLVAADGTKPLAVDWNESQGDAGSGTICWLAPSKGKAAQRDRLVKAIEVAAKSTIPGHTRFEVQRIKSPKKEGGACKVIVDFTNKPLQGEFAELILAATERGAPAPIVTTTLELNLDTLTEKDVAPAWEKVWATIAPPKPEPPPAPPAPPPAFIDQEVAVERQTFVPPPEVVDGAPWVSLVIAAGMMSRSLDGAPGPAIDDKSLLSLGGDATLHLDRAFGASNEHDIDIGVGYNRRFASATRGATKVSVDADRFEIGGLYRYHFGEGYLPRLGVLAGYELLRFELGADVDAFSVRYSVIRGGATIEQPIIIFDGGLVLLDLYGALRIPAGKDGGEPGTSFDIGGGPRLELAGGFLALARARYAQQSASTGGNELTDGYLDLEIGIGWQL
jgi:hypothetical protein